LGANEAEAQLASEPIAPKSKEFGRGQPSRKWEPLIEELRALSGAERLQRLVADDGINLGWVPEDLVPLDPRAIAQLSAGTVSELV